VKRYEEVAEQIRGKIREGVLRPGERIPSVRQISQVMQVSVSTVLHAYELLENEGSIEIRPQSGHYVRAHFKAIPDEPKVSVPSKRSRQVDVSELAFEILNAIKQPEIVPLGSPFPSPELFPLGKLNQYLCNVGRRSTPWNTVTSLPPGNDELQRQIARRYLEQGCDIHPDDIVITCGAMEALNICLQAVAKAGDIIAVESPTFYASLHAIERLGMRALEIPTHPREGIQLEALSDALKKHPVRACMLMSTFQNPLGSTMPAEKKRALLKLLEQYNVPLVEDDVYQELYFGEEAPKPLKAYDNKGLVLHCSSFSKTLAPGYRIGWVSPGRYRERVLQLKFMTTLSTASLPQLAIAEYLKHGGYEKHLRRVRQTLKYQQQMMVQQISQSFPEGTRVTRPEGGYVLWVELPEAVDALELYHQALRHNISIMPGPVFSAQKKYGNCIRLNYGHHWGKPLANTVDLLGQLSKQEV